MVMTMVMLMMRMGNFGAPCSAHLRAGDDDQDDVFTLRMLMVIMVMIITMIRMIEFWDHKTNESDGQKYFVGAYGVDNDGERGEKKN